MLGIVTEVTVKLLPAAGGQGAAGRLRLGGKGRSCGGDIIAAGIIPGGTEMMDNLSIRAAEDFIHAGYPVDAEAILLCELDGVKPTCTTTARASAKCSSGPAPPKCAAKDEAERVRFWAGRRMPSRRLDVSRRITTAWTAPSRAASCRACSRHFRSVRAVRPARNNVFHAGDGNMHPLILFDANQPGELERAEDLGGKILELCVKVGGSITGEHGVGRGRSTRCARSSTPTS